MRYNVKKIKSKIYLQLLDNIYDPKTKNSKSIILKTYGEVSKLKEIYENPIEHFRKIANAEIEKIKSEKIININIKATTARKFYNTKKNKKLFNNLIFIGHIFWSVFYYKLELDIIFKKISSRYKFEYSLSDVMKFLIFTKINFATSKRDSLYYINSMGEKYKFNDADIHRINKIIVENKTIILGWIYKKMPNIYKYNFKKSYYNLTTHTLEDKIELGLLFDKNDIPVNYSTHPDNNFLTKMLKTYHAKNTTTISEKEINSNSYILKYGVKKLSKELKNIFRNEIKPRIEKIKKEHPDLEYIYYPITLNNRKEKFIFQHYNKSKRKQAYIL
ncbi:hypothetical protein, partial [Oceanivirga salmonicida]|uniref:hypothetical protein n=1 Tax=Oceanivirga salmonicida TaxID=1769291 RepID=UPI0012E37AA6